MENEIAKLEKPDQLRCSSCEYPSSANRLSSALSSVCSATSCLQNLEGPIPVAGPGRGELNHRETRDVYTRVVTIRSRFARVAPAKRTALAERGRYCSAPLRSRPKAERDVPAADRARARVGSGGHVCENRGTRMSQPGPALTVDRLRAQIADGTIDTVVVAFPDMQGRLQGKRHPRPVLPRHRPRARDRGLQLPAGRRHRHEHGRGLCHQLLGARLRRHGVRARPRHAASRAVAARHGHADLRPRLARRRPHVRWSRAPARCCAPRSSRAAEQGLVALAGTELEFFVFNDTYEQAWDSAYRDLTPANQYNIDYSLIGTSRIEPLLRDIRNGMFAPAWSSSRPRASATSVSTRSPSSTTRSSAPPTTTPSTRTAPRRSRPSTARRCPSWRSSTSARATPVTST